MKTRSATKKKPEIIQIVSDDESIQQFKNDDSSSISSSECYSSVQSNSQEFLNLAPVQDNRKNAIKEGLKKFLFQQQPTNSFNVQQPQIKRAPVLNLLRPLPEKDSTKRKEQQSSAENNQQSIQVPSPFIQQGDEELIQQISKPRKKPKLMQQLQEDLNKPVEQYKLTGIGRQIRQQRKRQNKKRDYLIEKKFKQYKIGKKKDKVSNQIFNAIEDFFA